MFDTQDLFAQCFFPSVYLFQLCWWV